jgi:hypothetical protein
MFVKRYVVWFTSNVEPLKLMVRVEQLIKMNERATDDSDPKRTKV